MGIFSSMFRGIGSLFGAWNHGHADEAYKLLVAAGSGNARAKGTLDAIKRAAAGGDPRAIEAQRKIVAVAKMVTAGMPMPSVLAARKAAGQPLRLVSDTAALKATILRQQQALRQQRVRQAQAVQRLLAQQKQQSAKALAQRGQAEARINVRRAEQDEYEGKLADLRNQLMMRDIADDKRQALEAQAAEYEAKIAELTAPPEAPVESEYGPNVNVASPPPGEDFGEQAAPGDEEFNGEE